MNLVRKIKLKKRLLVCFLLLSIIPIILISFFTYKLSSNSAKRKLADSNKQLLSLINTNMKGEIEKYQYVCGSICINEDIQEALLKYDMSDIEKNKTILSIQDIVKTRIIYPANAKNITILDKNGRLFYDLGYDGFFQKDLEEIYSKTLNEDKDSFTYVKTYSGRDIIVLSRKIYNHYQKKEIIGFTLISIDEGLFSKTVLNPAEIHDGSNIILMDAYGTVLSSWDRSIPLGEKYNSSEIIKNINAINKNSGTFTLDIDGERQQVTYFYNRDIDKFFLSFVPYSYIDSAASVIARDVTIVAILLICVCCFILLFIHSSIADPVENMASACKDIEQGDLSVRINDSGQDELAFLAGSINSMVEEISSLLQIQKLQEKQKREVELQMLQYQINPHFLFNTLNTLKLVAQMNHDEVVSEGIKSLSELLKNTLVEKNEFISIEEEMNNLKNYMAIMKIRYAGSFTEIFELDESILKNKIPKLLLQPLIENSIVHGAPNDGRILNICIKCKEIGSDICIEIEDDGVGFDVNEVLTSNDSTASSTNPLKGLGTENVNQRIKLNFGDPYGVTIKSEKNKGTVCTVLIPAIKP
ncbi:two-component system, sensor histidine kinase YesM [Lachnospiraceae bacterium G11]|nr:two-component system, sensor histidine kinase YesM [Lachnospiraceae bacterium G11]